MPDTKPDRCGEWCCAEKVAGILALDPVAMTYHVEVSFPEALAAWERLGEYNEWNTERAERLLRGIDRLIPKDTGYGHARRQFALRIGREYSRVLYVSFEPLLFERVGCKVLGRRPHWELADDEPLPASIDGRDEEAVAVGRAKIVAGLERLARRACADEYGIYDPDAGRERYRTWWD